MVQSECSICLEVMQTLSYDSNKANGEDDCVDSEDKNCIRLICGHAFHASCIIQSMRAGTKCAMCREQPIDINQTFSVDSNENRLREIDDERHRLRITNRAIKNAREKLNKSVKEFRILSEVVKKERKNCIKKSLRTLRNKHRSEFRELVKIVKENVEEVKIIEIMELGKTKTKEEIEEYLLTFADYDYEARNLLQSNDFTCMDPLLNRFWTAT
jgi:hypothetical protein